MQRSRIALEGSDALGVGDYYPSRVARPYPVPVGLSTLPGRVVGST